LRPAGPRLRGDDGIADLLRDCYRRERVDVGDDVDDDGPVGLQCLLERRADLGRRAGRAPGYDYSPAVKNSKITWNEKTLDRWLADRRG
jgi:hypothetical protein